MTSSEGGGGRSSGRDPQCCKVGRTIESYGLSGMDEDLIDRWTGRTGEKYSLRDLERYFNERVLSAALWEADVDPLEGEVTNLYELLSSDDSGEVQARRRLEREGVDVERVTTDFVSHQAIHNHLRKCRNVELERDPNDRIDKARDTVAGLRNRLIAVTENTLRRLDRSGAISLGEFSVFVNVQITCEECGKYYTVSELLDERGCTCRDDRTDAE